MTRQEIEMTLLHMGEALETIVKAYSPEANQMSIRVINGQIHVSAGKYTEGQGLTETIDATKYLDGVIRSGDRYTINDKHLAG